tara:strand:- start:823 stop:1083 length:261 start_codon:yes stop_codon:yes gene_type:complete
METRDKFRQMVKYLLNGEPTKDAKTIDNYTDSLMLGCQQYHEEQVKKDLIAGVVGRSKQFFCNNESMGVRCVKQCLGCDQFENSMG